MNKIEGAKKRKILVTNALTYANGNLHIGHMIGYLTADIWVRFLKLRGHKCTFIGGSDCHGTPIMIKAKENKIDPQQLSNKYFQQHRLDCENFLIDMDNFYHTDCCENQILTEQIYKQLEKKGLILEREIEQLFDVENNIFLPDRFIKGKCPKCYAKDQYGDNCAVCGATYTPDDLIDPYSTISNKQLVKRLSNHLFINLKKYTDSLKKWTENHLTKHVKNKINEWFISGLEDWNISRDAPYLGFQIPGKDNKYFYVWFDAPIGYMAIFKNLVQKRDDLDFDDYWGQDGEERTELYHFIGKDIIYFHSIFWLAILLGGNFRLPTANCVHGFLNIGGNKISKSRHNFIEVSDYLKIFPPAYMRYYLASKLADNFEDIDFTWEEFQNKINADLVGKLINIASRCAKFINEKFHNLLSETIDLDEFNYFAQRGDFIATCYEERKFSLALTEIMNLCDRVNNMITQKEPWKMIKEEKSIPDVQTSCSLGLNLFMQLIIYLKPVLPDLAAKVEEFFQVTPFIWEDSKEPLLGKEILKFVPLLHRVTKRDIEKIEDLDLERREEVNLGKKKIDDKMKKVSCNDFKKIELVVGRVIKASTVVGSDKLLKLEVDIGNELREIFTGIGKFYQPVNLQGQLVIVVANLAPKKMTFGISNGMILCASDKETKRLYIITPQGEPGMIIN